MTPANSTMVRDRRTGKMRKKNMKISRAVRQSSKAKAAHRKPVTQATKAKRARTMKKVIRTGKTTTGRRVRKVMVRKTTVRKAPARKVAVRRAAGRK